MDHYRLDQFDQMFIMNYQKLSEAEVRSNSKVRMVIGYLTENQKITKFSLKGVAMKPFGLGFLYKIFITLGDQNQLVVG